LLAAWDAAQHDMADAAAQAGAVLVVGFSTGIGRDILPAVSARFAERRPGWRLQLRQVDWNDPSAGVADHSCDVAYVWLPLAGAAERFGCVVVAVEDRHVALPAGHRLVGLEVVPFADLADEPFLALPRSSGGLRDYWLAVAERGGRPPVIAAEVTNADETFEAVANGIGVVLLSAGNAAIYRRAGVVTRPVAGVGPSELALIWRADDPRPAVHDFIATHGG
jgi:DNA-binding transcriptional LysR family regulator